MDSKTMVVLLFAIAVIGGGIAWGVTGSVQRAQIRANATVATAQEHTRRAEGRHDLVDILGWARGWQNQRDRNKD